MEYRNRKQLGELTRLFLACLMLAGSLTAKPACAQSTASIGGAVADASGAVVSGAQVLLKNVDTNVEQSATTNSTGNYAIFEITPGNYSLTVTKAGFSAAQRTNIVLTVNQAATFNFTLQVGAVQQSVTVSSEAGELQSSTAALGTVIGTKPVNNLPLNGRNFTELLELTPGVSRISVSQNSGKGPTQNPIGQFTFPAVNGQRNRSNNFLLDGINDLGSYTGDYNFQPIIDDIEEFKVESHSDLAEFGQVTGGIVSVATKNGTNALHGSLWEFLRNSAFDAENYFTRSLAPLRQNQFGGTVGGPVIIPHVYHGSDKTFFFFAYEGFRQSTTSEVLYTTPTSAQLSGDFSNLLAKGVVVYNPFSTRPDPQHSGEYLRDPFPNNQIPASLLSPVSLLYAKYVFPAPNATGLAAGQNYINTTPSLLQSGSYSGRIDQSFGRHDLLYGRVSEYNQPSSASAGTPYVINDATISGYNITIHEVHTFGPTSVLDAYFGRNVGTNVIQLQFPKAPAAFGTDLINNGFSNLFLGGYSGPHSTIAPSITVEGYLGNGGNYYQNPTFTNTYEYGGAYNKLWGRHNFKLGGDIATNDFSMDVASATESTSPFQTSNLEQPTSAGGAPTGDALASFLLGVPTSTQTRNTNEIEHNGWVDGAYFQDQIQVNPRLTVNLGVRWDVTIWPINGNLSNGQGYLGDMNLNNGTYVISAVPPACSTTVGAPCIPGGTLPANVVVTQLGGHAIHHTDYGNWQGRVGFAYHPRPETSVLAGYGRFYDSWSTATQYSQNLGGTWPSVGLLNANTLNETTATALMTDPLNEGAGKVFLPPATPFNNATFYFNPYMLTAYSDQWNLTVEQAIGATAVWSLGYAGSHTSRLDLGGLHNTAEYPAPGNAAAVASRRQYPYIIPTDYDDSRGNSNYNSLQTTLNKMAGNGLTYLLSYTWSKSIDVGCSDSFAGNCIVQDPYHPQLDRAVSGFDLTNMFSGSVLYQLPFGDGRRFKSGNTLVNDALGGWEVNAITSFTSGTPYSVTVRGDIANTGNNFVQADLVGNPNPPQRSPAEWINRSAFVSPPRYTFGTFGRNALRSDWYKDVDLSVFKSFPVARKANLIFRAEAFNVTNTPVFAAPNNVVGQPTFGSVSALARDPRELQFALKLQF